MVFKRALSVAVVAALAAPALAAEDVEGRWLRPNGDVVVAAVADGKLACHIDTGSRPGFEMCHGMVRQGDAWTGSGMKHPEMPGFMTFNGTVVVFGDELKIKGCAIGQAFCDSETWTRAPQ
ncbi:MAG: hypothetical protein WAT70_14575 [Rhizobiaceae bacterium]